MDDMLKSHHVCLLKRGRFHLYVKQKSLIGPQRESNRGELYPQILLPSFAVSYSCHLLVNSRCLRFEALVVDGF